MPASQGQRPDGLLQNVYIGNQGDQFASELHGKYYTQASKGNLFVAHAIVTAPVIYSTNVGTGGPLLYNPPGSGVNVALLAVGFGVTVVTTVAAAIGIAFNSTPNVQLVVPTTTTAIDTSGNLKIGGAVSKINAYRIGTVAVAANVFMPFASVHTGALTTDTEGVEYVDLGGMVVCPQGSFVSVAASATATTLVMQSFLVWEEVPVASTY